MCIIRIIHDNILFTYMAAIFNYYQSSVYYLVISTNSIKYIGNDVILQDIKLSSFKGCNEVDKTFFSLSLFIHR